MLIGVILLNKMEDNLNNGYKDKEEGCWDD